MIPIDLIVSLVVLAVAIYALYRTYGVIKSLGIVLVERALIFYLFIIAADRMIIAACIMAGITCPVGVTHILWCLYIVGISLIVWEIYRYLTITK